MHKKGFYYSLALSLTMANTLYASPAVIMQVSDAPPPGFAVMAKPQRILVDVFYEGKHLGAFPAIVSPSKIRFIHPHVFLSKIKHLKKSYLIAQELSRTESNNSNLICRNKDAIRKCGVLEPSVAGVIYNPNTFTANLFINPKFISHKTNNPFALLPDSTAGFSYTNTLDMVAAGNTNQDTSLEDAGISESTKNNYSFTTDNVFADGNNKAEASLSFANNIDGKEQVLINEADVQRVSGMHSYSAGLIQTTGSQFFPNISILGGEFASTLKTMPDALDEASTPLIIYLNFPSQVSVYKNRQLIYTKYLQGGYQRIDTRTFPEGAYQLTVKIVDSQGHANTQQYYYVKNAELPPQGLPQYSITAGYEVATPQFDDSTSTRILNIPVYQFNYTWRVDNTMGLSVNSIGSDKNIFAAMGPVWIYGPTQFSIGGLVGTAGRYGISSNASYTRTKFSASINYLRIFNNDASKNFNANDSSTYYDRLITSNDNQVSGALSYDLDPQTIFSLIGSYNKTPGADGTYSYGATLGRTYHVSNTGNMDLSLGANRSNNDYAVTLNLVFTFDTPNTAASLQTGYLYQRGIHTNNNSDLNNNGFQAAGTYNWFHHNDNNYGYNFGLHGNVSPSSNNVGANYSNTNAYAKESIYGNYNHTNNFGGNDSQYGGEFKTQFTYVNGVANFSNPSLGDDTGVMVYVKSPDPKAKFIVHTEQRPGFVIKANQHYFLPLTSYGQYDINVSNDSNKVFAMKHPQSQVTLYPGNVQLLKLNAVLQTVVIGRLVDQHGKVINNAVLTAGLGESYTDDRGYFQVSVESEKPKVLARYDDKTCELVLPKIDPKKDYIYLGDVQCRSIK